VPPRVKCCSRASPGGGPPRPHQRLKLDHCKIAVARRRTASTPCRTASIQREVGAARPFLVLAYSEWEPDLAKVGVANSSRRALSNADFGNERAQISRTLRRRFETSTRDHASASRAIAVAPGKASRYRRPRLALPECSSAAPPRTSGQPTPRPMFVSVSASACSTSSASSAFVVDRWIVTVELPGSASATCSQPW
jgi:hypothetical protein